MAATSAQAQLIPVHTSRVAEGDLSGFLPVANGGLGTLLTIPDTLADPFSNPASAMRVSRRYVMAAPTVWGMGRGRGGGSTYPFGALASRGAWFGGLVGAQQSLSRAGGIPSSRLPIGPNRHLFALLGRRLGSGSVGLSVRSSSLGALDGAELLYPTASAVARSASALDVRAGTTQRIGDRNTMEAVLLAVRSSATHDVTFSDRMWNPVTRTIVVTPRDEHDKDRVDSYGAHVTFVHALDSTWQLGTLFTANRNEHSRQPVLGAMSVANDPARTTALNAGGGIGFRKGAWRAGVDAFYEPIWGRSTLTSTPNDDEYRFHNAVARGGVSRMFFVDAATAIGVQFGAQMRAMNFDLTQRDSLGVSHTSYKAWQEWTHSWGVSFMSPALEMHCRWRLQSGLRRPPASETSGFFGPVPLTFDQFGVPVTQPATMTAVRVATVQFSFVVPIP